MSKGEGGDTDRPRRGPKPTEPAIKPKDVTVHNTDEEDGAGPGPGNWKGGK